MADYGGALMVQQHGSAAVAAATSSGGSGQRNQRINRRLYQGERQKKTISKSKHGGITTASMAKSMETASSKKDSKQHGASNMAWQTSAAATARHGGGAGWDVDWQKQLTAAWR